MGHWVWWALDGALDGALNGALNGGHRVVCIEAAAMGGCLAERERRGQGCHSGCEAAFGRSCVTACECG